MIKVTLPLLMLSLLSACISMPAYVPLAPENKNSLREMNATTVVAQDEIIVTAQDPGASRALGGGLLAALIDSNIAKGRQQDIQALIEPFYESVDDVDFRKEFWSAFVPYLKNSYPVKVAEVKTTALAPTREDIDKIQEKLPPGKGFMLIGTGYRFSPGYSRLVMVTGIDIWQAGQKEKVYSNVFTYQSAEISPGASNPLQLWGADSGKSYRAAVSDGVAETIKMFKLDMEYPRLGGKDPANLKSVTVNHLTDAGQPANFSGPALDEQSSRVVVRNTEGRLLSLPR